MNHPDEEPVAPKREDWPKAAYDAVLYSTLRHAGLDDAQECVQEAYLAASKSAPSFECYRHYVCWLTKVAKRYVIGRIRRRRLFLEPLPIAEVAVESDPAAKAENAEMTCIIRDCLSHLSEQDRKALLAWRVEELPFREVAERLDLQTRSGARKRIRKIWESLLRCVRSKALVTFL